MLAQCPYLSRGMPIAVLRSMQAIGYCCWLGSLPSRGIDSFSAFKTRET
jgi:hypothetical protein